MSIDSDLPIDEFLRNCGITTELKRPSRNTNRKCIVCKKSAVYGLSNRKAEYCVTHKPTNAFNVRSTLCSCGKVPHYGITKRITCSECKLPEHRMLDSRVCSCGKYASFGLPGGPRLSCGKCKLEGYVLLSANKCPVCNIKLARFGPPNGKKLTCKDCKQPDYIDLSKGPRCVVCNSKAYYRLPGCRADRCEKHKTQNHML